MKGRSVSIVGILFWIIAPVFILALVASPFLMPFVNSVADNAAARRDQQAANRAQAEAVKTGAEAQAEALLSLTAEGVEAIKADRRKAHPLQYAAELIGKAVLVVLTLVAFGTMGLAVIAYKHPGLAATILATLVRRRA